MIKEDGDADSLDEIKQTGSEVKSAADKAGNMAKKHKAKKAAKDAEDGADSDGDDPNGDKNADDKGEEGDSSSDGNPEADNKADADGDSQKESTDENKSNDDNSKSDSEGAGSDDKSESAQPEKSENLSDSENGHNLNAANEERPEGGNRDSSSGGEHSDSDNEEKSNRRNNSGSEERNGGGGNRGGSNGSGSNGGEGSKGGGTGNGHSSGGASGQPGHSSGMAQNATGAAGKGSEAAAKAAASESGKAAASGGAKAAVKAAAKTASVAVKKYVAIGIIVVVIIGLIVSIISSALPNVVGMKVLGLDGRNGDGDPYYVNTYEDGKNPFQVGYDDVNTDVQSALLEAKNKSVDAIIKDIKKQQKKDGVSAADDPTLDIDGADLQLNKGTVVEYGDKNNLDIMHYTIEYNDYSNIGNLNDSNNILDSTYIMATYSVSQCNQAHSSVRIDEDDYNFSGTDVSHMVKKIKKADDLYTVTSEAPTTRSDEVHFTDPTTFDYIPSGTVASISSTYPASKVKSAKYVTGGNVSYEGKYWFPETAVKSMTVNDLNDTRKWIVASDPVILTVDDTKYYSYGAMKWPAGNSPIYSDPATGVYFASSLPSGSESISVNGEMFYFCNNINPNSYIPANTNGYIITIAKEWIIGWGNVDLTGHYNNGSFSTGGQRQIKARFTTEASVKPMPATDRIEYRQWTDLSYTISSMNKNSVWDVFFEIEKFTDKGNVNDVYYYDKFKKQYYTYDKELKKKNLEFGQMTKVHHKNIVLGSEFTLLSKDGTEKKIELNRDNYKGVACKSMIYLDTHTTNDETVNNVQYNFLETIYGNVEQIMAAQGMAAEVTNNSLKGIPWYRLVSPPGDSYKKRETPTSQADNISSSFRGWTQAQVKEEMVRIFGEAALADVKTVSKPTVGEYVVTLTGNDGATKTEYWLSSAYYEASSTLINPLTFAPYHLEIRSPFGYRTDPIAGTTRYHNGVDLGNHDGGSSSGAPICACASGTVSWAGWGTGGNSIWINHGGGLRTFYCHMSSPALFSTGQRVEQGQIIGYVGMTGYATGPHLHFAVEYNGSYVDPLDYCPSLYTLPRI